jgi:GNAT superfamily N-acetyltransferase
VPLNLDPGLRRACDGNVRASCAAIARSTFGGAVFEVGPSLVVRTGIPAASFNPVFALERVRDPPRLVERIRTRLVDRQTPWMLVTTPDVRLGLTPVLDAFGLARRRVMPVMVLDLDERPPEPVSASLTIRPANEPDEVRRWARTFEHGLEAPRDFLAPWIEGWIAQPPSTTGGFQLYLGTVDDAPVATAARVTTRPTSGVYFVQTYAEHRRRGYGRALTAAAADAREAGCAVSCLQATAMGRPLYESIGYRTIGEYECWQTPRPVATPPSAPGTAGGSTTSPAPG